MNDQKHAPVNISKSLTLSQDDSWTALSHLSIEFNGFIKYIKDSMDDFYNVGIEKIMTDVFDIRESIDNVRDKTSADRAIKTIVTYVKFSNIRLKSPVTAAYASGHERVLFPNVAHINDRSYNSSIYGDVEIGATAIGHDGQTQVKTEYIKNHRISAIYTVVGTQPCNLYKKTRKAKLQVQSDPDDDGGYIIIRGKEWAIDTRESTCFNQCRIFNNRWKKELQRLEFISKPGDTYDNSKFIIIRLVKNGNLTIEFNTPTMKEIEFPFYIIFRLLGWATDGQILNAILYSDIGVVGDPAVEHSNLHTKMSAILKQSFKSSYETKHGKFGGMLNVYGQGHIQEQVVKRLHKDSYQDLNMENDIGVQQAIEKLMNKIDIELLPHIGLDSTTRNKKLIFLGYMIHRMLLVNLGVIPQTDRDSYVRKRFHTPGIVSGKSFKTHFNSSIVASLKKQLIRDFRSMPFTSVTLTQSFLGAFSGAEFSRLMTQSITTGNKTKLKINPRKQTINRTSTQLLDRKNGLKVISTLRMLVSSNSSDGSNKNSTRAHKMRMPHPSMQYFACLIQSPEGGDKVGLHKQAAITCSVTTYGSSEFLKNNIREDPILIDIQDLYLLDMHRLSRVFVNGDWIGCVEDSAKMVNLYTKKRRYGEIDRHTTIEWDTYIDEIYFWVDYGRVTVPLIIVYNNVRDWEELEMKSPLDPKDEIKDFIQGTGLTSDIMTDIYAGKYTIDDLVQMRLIEYITPAEISRLYVAVDVAKLKHHENDVLHQFTHLGVPENMVGVAALTSPLANYNATPRNTFQTAQVRQTGSQYAGNYAYRIDKDTFNQNRCSLPLATTRINKYLKPAGQMVMIAIQCYTEFNIEDSTIFSKLTSDSGMFNGSWFTYDKVSLERGETVGVPDMEKTLGIKRYANYSKLDANGIIPIGTIVQKDDVVVGKLQKLTKKASIDKDVEFMDHSAVYKLLSPSIVHNVFVTKDDDATDIIKIAYRSLKPVIVGNKFSSRCFTPEHEVLTKYGGWTTIADVTKEDLLATLDADGVMTYDYPTEILEYDYDGRVIEFENKTSKFTVTDNHKMFVKYKSNQAWKNKATNNDEYKLENKEGYISNEAGFIFDNKKAWATNKKASKVVMKCDARYDPDEIKTYTIKGQVVGGNNKKHKLPDIDVDMDVWLKFLGLFIAEGHVDKANCTRISAHKARVKTLIAEIAEYDPVLFEYKTYGTKDPHTYYFKDRRLSFDLTICGKGTDKGMCDWFTDLNKRQSTILFEAMCVGDGDYKKTGKIGNYSTASSMLRSQVEQLILHCGLVGITRVDGKAGDVVTIKGNKTIRKTNQYRTSLSHKRMTTLFGPEHISEKQYVGKVYCVEVPHNTIMVRNSTCLGQWKGAWQNNSAQKGICGLILNQKDMPFTANGMIPNLIMNPHSFPSRMTVSQNIEQSVSKICAARGVTCDATIFRQLDVNKISEEMKNLGLDRYGRERLYCGLTGAWIDTEIYFGPTYYQLLQKLVEKSIYAINMGPTDIMTRQPLDGKASNGGLRISELQRDVILSHGASRIFSIKFFKHSDDFDIYICRCGNRAIVNLYRGDYNCPKCGEYADVNVINSSWTSKQFMLEQNAMHIGTKFELEPFIFYD